MAEKADRSCLSQSQVVDREEVRTCALYSKIDPNFVLNRETATRGEIPFAFSDGEYVVAETRARPETRERQAVETINSKLTLSFQGKLYGRMEVTAKRPRSVAQVQCPNTDTKDSSQTFIQELEFLSKHSCYWLHHPNVILYHGLVFMKEGEENIPYLLSERVSWDLGSLLNDKRVQLSHRNKVFIVRDIASGLSFLHSRKPANIIHAALVASSILLTRSGDAKLTNFFHAGKLNDRLTIKSKAHADLLPWCRDGQKLEVWLDIKALGILIQEIDSKRTSREQWKVQNILKDLYMLSECETSDLPPEFSASEVCRRLCSYLENPRTRQSQEREQSLSVSSYIIVLVSYTMYMYNDMIFLLLNITW